MHRVLVYAIPLVAVLIVGVVLYAGTAPHPAVVKQFSTDLIIDIVGFDALGRTITRTIHPAGNIGVPGGVMGTDRFLQYGVAGYYPLYTIDTSGVVYVQSTNARNYTLGDFFEVWGEPLGAANTLGYKANYTSTGHVDFYWEMCIHAASADIPTSDWGNHILKSQEVLHLVYSRVGCVY
ncbi:MAG TPA: hypothetical protein VFE98_00380 [Candidatus Bathyarchaeia archaeon]|nr:hypothetical protein [Candidatus Bathyarchaeia archaeon]